MLERLKLIIKEENINISEDAISAITELSDGGMRDALSLLDQAVSYTDKQISIDDVHELNGTITPQNMKLFIENILSNNIEDIFKQIDIFYENGKDFYKLTEEIIIYLRNILIYKNMPNYFENGQNYEINIDIENLFKLIDIFNNSLYEMKNSANNKLIFELSILKIINNNSNTVQNKQIDEQPKIKEKIDIKKIENINKIRINNTLCFFNKKEYIDFRNNINQIQKYLIDKKYTEVASLILDGEIKAYGNNYFIILFNNDSDVSLFNEKFELIDELMFKTYNSKIHGTAVNQNMWNNIKQEFNNKEKQYNYIEE
jgi:DNA polymerase-3 subunit gamma/tau